MEILEAFKVVVPVGNQVLIYEFRGRYLKSVETPQPTAQVINPSKGNRVRSIYVAAENLSDAVLHLQTYRSNFLPREAFVRGRILMDSRDRDIALKILKRRLRHAQQTKA